MPKQTYLHSGKRLPETLLGYRRVGKGRTAVIALHDWRGDHRLYSQAIPVLDRTRFTHILPDIRGYGLSFDLRGQHTVDEIVSDVLRLADSLGFARFHLVGHSLTALAAERIVAAAPTRVQSLALLAPFRWRNMQLVRAAAGVAAFLPDLTDEQSHSGARKPRIAPAPLPETRRAYLDAADAELRSRFDDAPTSALLLIGECDQYIDAQRAWRAVAKGGNLRLVEGAGHFLVDDDPVRCVRLLQTFQLAHTPEVTGAHVDPATPQDADAGREKQL